MYYHELRAARKTSLPCLLGLRQFRVLFLLAAASIFPSTLRAAEPRDLLRYLPENTLVAIQAPDAKQLIADWDASALARFYDDPRAAACLAPLRARVAELEKKLPGGDPGSLARALQCLTGSIVLAATPSAKGESSPFSWILMFEYDGKPLAKQILEGEAVLGHDGRIEKTPAAAGSKNYTRVIIIRPSPAAAPIETRAQLDQIPMGGKSKSKSSPKADNTANGNSRDQRREFDDYFGPDLAIHAEADGAPIAAILNRIDSGDGNGAGSLRGILEAQSIRPDSGKANAKSSKSGVEAYINLHELGKWYQRRRSGALLGGYLHPERLGLDGAGWYAASAHFDKDRIWLSGRATAPLPAQGIGKLLFLGGAAPPDAAGLIPSGAIDYSSSALSPAKLWDFAMESLGGPDDPIKMLIDAQLSAFSQSSGVDLRRDLIGNLGDAIVRFVPSLPVDQSSGRRDAFVDPGVLMLEAADPAPVARGIGAILQYGTQIFGAYQLDKSQPSGGATLWTLRGGRPSAGYVGSPFLYVAMAGKWVMISRRSEGISASIALAEKPDGALKSNPAFRGAMEQLPAGRYAEGFADFAGLLRLIDEKFIPQVPAAGAPAAQAGWINAAAAPDRKTMDEFFGPFERAFSKRDDGTGFDAFLVLRETKGN